MTNISQSSNSTVTVPGCRWCSGLSAQTYHSGKCPKVKRLRLDEYGSVVEVEFWPETEGSL